MEKESILVIANPYDTATLGRALEDVGYRTLRSDPNRITELSETPVAAIVDSGLNSSNAQDVISTIRNRWVDIPILLLGRSSGQVKSFANALELGASHLLIRPIDPYVIAKKIDRILCVDEPGKEEKERPASPSPFELETEVFDTSSLNRLPNDGICSEYDMPTILHLARTNSFSGSIRFERDQITKTIFFDDGYPVFATSDAPFDRLNELLRREGRLSRAQIESYSRICERDGRRLGALLIEEGIIEDTQLFPLIRRHVLEIIYSLFSWEQGQFRLDSLASSHEERIRLDKHPSAIILEGIRRKYGLDRLTEKLGTSNAHYRLYEDIELSDFELEEDEILTVRKLVNEQSLASLQSQSVLSRERCYQVVYGLFVLGAIINTHSEKSVKSKKSLPTLSRDFVAEKYRQVEESDYFTLLGVGIDASDREIEGAYLELSKEFSPDKFSHLSRSYDIEPQDIELLQQVLAEAYRILSDEALRRAYKSTLIN